MALLHSTGLSSSNEPVDDDFFNEPSVLRVNLTASEAAAGAKDNAPSSNEASSTTNSSTTTPATSGTSNTKTTYQVIAQGMPGAKIHYAAPSA